jgi:hypothetical protein
LRLAAAVLVNRFHAVIIDNSDPDGEFVFCGGRPSVSLPGVFSFESTRRRQSEFFALVLMQRTMIAFLPLEEDFALVWSLQDVAFRVTLQKQDENASQKTRQSENKLLRQNRLAG